MKEKTWEENKKISSKYCQLFEKCNNLHVLISCVVQLIDFNSMYSVIPPLECELLEKVNKTKIKEIFKGGPLAIGSEKTDIMKDLKCIARHFFFC